MYLANDVIQNSKKKGPEYGREFLKVLPKAFQHIGECCASDEKTNASLARILSIWEERGVYEAKICHDFRAAMRPQSQQKTASASTSASASSASSSSAADAAAAADADTPTEDDWMSDGQTTTAATTTTKTAAAVNGDGLKRKLPLGSLDASRDDKRAKAAGDATLSSEDINGAVETHVVLQQPANEPAGELRVHSIDCKRMNSHGMFCYPLQAIRPSPRS